MFGSAVLLGGIVQSVRELVGSNRLVWLPAASTALCLLPLGDLSLGRFVHSFTGFLSLPLMSLLAWYLLKPLFFQHISDQELHHRYWWLMVLIGGPYFAVAMGMGNFDVHQWGWQPSFIWLPVGISIALLCLGDYALAGLVAMAMFAWRWGWLDTSNGWSYLVDPLAAGFSAFGLAGMGLRRGWQMIAILTIKTRFRTGH